MKKIKLTIEQNIILDTWYQFAPYSRYGKGRWAGGKSTLESIQAYLKEKKIINSWGNKRPEIMW